MKKIFLAIYFVFTLNVFAHEPGEPIKVDCFISDVSVVEFNLPGDLCFKDKHPEGYDEQKATSALGCTVTVSVGYSLGLHDLSVLRKGVSFYDMKTVISFKDGQKFTSMSKFFTMNPTVYVRLGGEKILRFYNREEPTDVQCLVL